MRAARACGPSSATSRCPAATQNEIDEESAKALVANGCTVVCEGANMPSTPEAIEVYKANNVLYGPAKPRTPAAWPSPVWR